MFVQSQKHVLTGSLLPKRFFFLFTILHDCLKIFAEIPGISVLRRHVLRVLKVVYEQNKNNSGNVNDIYCDTRQSRFFLQSRFLFVFVFFFCIVILMMWLCPDSTFQEIKGGISVRSNTRLSSKVTFFTSGFEVGPRQYCLCRTWSLSETKLFCHVPGIPTVFSPHPTDIPLSVPLTVARSQN